MRIVYDRAKKLMEDIQHTKDIDRIIKGGRIYTQEEVLES
jgi:hypothetical protein